MSEPNVDNYSSKSDFISMKTMKTKRNMTILQC